MKPRIFLYLIVALLIGFFVSPAICTNFYEAGEGQVLLEKQDYLGVEAVEQSILEQSQSRGRLIVTLSLLGIQLPFWVLFILTFETMGSPSGKKKKILTASYWVIWLLGITFLSFLIPYLLADFHFPMSIILSISIYLFFSVIVGFVYMVSKYFLILLKKMMPVTRNNYLPIEENYLYR